jgi:outer membrane protein assembly factor BamB
MKYFTVIIILVISIFHSELNGQEVAQWRGQNRDGIYNETGLLKNWPNKGPELLWHYDNLGPGHASAAVTKEFVYTAGTTDAGKGIVIALNHNGEFVWQTEIGEEWMDNFEGTRSTPLIYNGKVYILSSYGNLYCLDTKSGNVIWKEDLFKEYDGQNIKWGITENLLINDNILYVTPGGNRANIIALDKDNGKLIWESEGMKELSAYCSPIVFEINGNKIFVTQTASSIIGLDAINGDMLWTFDHPNKWSVQANTPLYHDGKLYCFSGYGKGGVMLQVSNDGKGITKLWENTSLDSKMGGAVLVDGKIYGSGDHNKEWFCLNWETGEELYSNDMLKVGNIIYSDGLLYCYGTGGKVGIVDPKTNDFNVISSFEVPYGEKYHWAHLVINNSRLYVRHGTSLMVYDISAN